MDKLFVYSFPVDMAPWGSRTFVLAEYQRALGGFFSQRRLQNFVAAVLSRAGLLNEHDRAHQVLGILGRAWEYCNRRAIAYASDPSGSKPFNWTLEGAPSFLARCVVREAIRMTKMQHREREYESEIRAFSERRACAPSISEPDAFGQLYRRLVDGVRVPEDVACDLIYHHVFGLTVQELSSIRGLSKSTMQRRLASYRDQLARRISQNTAEDREAWEGC